MIYYSQRFLRKSFKVSQTILSIRSARVLFSCCLALVVAYYFMRYLPTGCFILIVPHASTRGPFLDYYTFDQKSHIPRQFFILSIITVLCDLLTNELKRSTK